jgi:hypothetical protein
MAARTRPFLPVIHDVGTRREKHMYSLPIEVVTNWVNQQNLWLPDSVDFVCPYCGRQVNFGFPQWRFDQHQSAAITSANCSGCRKKVRFWGIDPVKYGETGGRECAELCMHPTPQLQRQPMAGLDKVPPLIAKAYISAINVYNTKEWNGTAMLTGRTLEGLVKGLMPEGKRERPLAQMLAELPKEIDLTKTLTTLVDGLRKGRNLGAHFDLQRETSEEVARMMVEMLEYFLEYLYILPGQVDELHNRL